MRITVFGLILCLLTGGCGVESQGELDALHDESKALFEDGKLRKAELKTSELFERIENLPPGSTKDRSKIRCLKLLAEIAFELDGENDPLELADQILEMETDIQTQAFAYHLKAEVYMNLDLFAQAVKFYEKALPLYKSSSPGSLELAELYVSLGGAAFAEGSQDMLFSGNKELIRSRALESKNFIEEGLRINRALEDSEDSRIVQVMACFLMVPISGVLEQDDSQTKFLHLAEHLTMRELENDPDNPELLLLKQMIEVQKFSIATDEKFKRDLEQIVDQSKKGIDRIERMMQETINQFE